MDSYPALTDVLAISKATLLQCKEAASHFGNSEVGPLLCGLETPLTRLCDLLELAVDDADISNRITTITVGGVSEASRAFLETLDVDLRTLRTSLSNIGSANPTALCKTDVDVYVQALNRYSEVLKLVQKRNMIDMVQRIHDEVVCLNSDLTILHAHLSKADRSSQDELLNRLDRLRPVLSALHNATNAPPSCMAGTREQAIIDIFDWADDLRPSTPQVFWLYGFAGSGKTAILQSVAERAHREGRLLASFLFSRTGDSHRRDHTSLVPTLAYQIARFDRDYLRRITGAIAQHWEIRDQRAELQIAVLLQCTLADATSTHDLPLLIVLDAIDECDQMNSPEVKLIFRLLIEVLTKLSLRVKFFITSRHECSIRQMFDEPTFPEHWPFALHRDIEQHVVEADIAWYIETSLQQMSLSHRLDQCGYPSGTEVRELATRSGASFVYASTIMRYISGATEDPRLQLEQVMSRQLRHSAEQHQLVDELYTQILVLAIRSGSRSNGYDWSSDLRKLLGTIIASQAELNSKLLSALAEVREFETRELLSRMSSVLVHEPGATIRPFHHSFLEYIQDVNRCDDERFVVSERQAHAHLAYRCLSLLNTHLCYNICKLKHPWIPNTCVPDLQQRLQQTIPSGLQYATTHWYTHLQQVGDLTPSILDQLDNFCQNKILSWVELLSLTNGLSIIRGTFYKSFCCLKTSNAPPDCLILLEDTCHMINKYWMPLNSHALHVYFSALLSMPNCYLQRCYQSLQPQTSPQLITKRAEAWYHRDQVFEGQPNDRCGNFMCSPSGTHWASINTLGDVLVWDTWSETVVQQSPPDSQVIRHGQGYTDHALRPHFCSVAWSPDGEYVVTMDITGTVAVFCLQTRAIDYIFTSSEADLYRHIDTSQRVLGTESNCIAVSPDGQRVLLYSWDHLTWIETASGRVDQVQLCDLPILWRTSTLCITISQDSRHIAVAYVPNTTHIWDTQTGRLAYVLDCPLHCTSMLFSQHSRYFASLSHSHGIAVWDMTDTTYRAMIVPKRLPCSKSSIAFSWSEDLLSVPSSLHATAIEIWSLNTGQLIQTLEGYAVLYKVLSFTPAGQLVATFGDDQIRLMHPLNTDVASPRAAGLQGHSSAVEFLTLCENGDCLFCVSFCPGDGTLLMWNGYTGELMGTIDISPFLMVPMRNGEFPKPVTYNCSVDGRFVAIGMPSKDDITRTLGVADQDAHIDVIILVWDNLVGRFVKEATGRARCHWEIINVEQESPEVSGFTSSPDPESMPTYRHTHTVDILHPDDSGSIIVQGVTGCLQHFSSCKKMHQAQNLTQSCSLSARTWHDVLFVVLNNVCVDEISASPEPNNKDLTISAPLHIVGHDKLVHGYRLDSFWKMPDYNYLALSGDSISTEELKFKWTETLSFTPDLFNLQHAALLIDANSGWLICLLPSQRIGQARTRISLCWLPPELRSGKPVLQWSQKHQRVVIGAQTGIVTILDLSHFIRHYTTS